MSGTPDPPVVFGADRGEQLAVVFLALLALVGVVVAGVNRSGWGVAFFALAAAAMAAAAVLVVRFRIVIDDVGIHRRLVGVTTVVWDRVATVRTFSAGSKSGRSAVAVVVDDLTALSLPATKGSSLSAEQVMRWRIAAAGPAPGIVLDNPRHQRLPVEVTTVLARMGRVRVGVLAVLAVLTAALDVTWLVVAVRAPAGESVWVLPVFFFVVAIVMAISLPRGVRRARLVASPSGVDLPPGSTVKHVGWDEVEAFVAVGWPDSRRWTLAAVHGPVVQRLGLPLKGFSDARPRAEIGRISDTLNAALVARRSKHWRDLTDQRGQQLLQPKPLWRPSSPRYRTVLLAALVASGVLLAISAAVVGVAGAHDTDAVVQRAVAAPATVVAFDQDQSGSTQAVLRYTAGGHDKTMTVSYGSNLLTLGDRIWILYDPLDPSDAWAPPYGGPRHELRDDTIIGLVFAAIACLAAAPILRSQWKHRPPPPSTPESPASRTATTQP